jgi:amino acid transporter
MKGQEAPNGSQQLLIENNRSADLKKELGLPDLVLTQVLFIVGLTWVGVAAKQGPSHVVLWILAMIFFYIPSAAVVIYLNRIMPLEGGVYQWVKLGFNERSGFLIAWNLWLFTILSTSGIGLQVSQFLTYIIEPGGGLLTESRWFTILISLVTVGLLVSLAIIGLGVGKWVHKAGAVLMLITFAALLALPLLESGKAEPSESAGLSPTIPFFSLMSLNLFSKMGFGAFGGFEYVAIHAGECRDPVRAIGRSVAIAAPVIAVMFIFGTNSVLLLVPRDEIDLIAPIPQVLSKGLNSISFAAAVAPLTILALLCIRVAQSSVMFAGATRLPMVAGWDRLMPDWFTRLHNSRKTPVNSILFVGTATLILSVIGLIGVGKQEAFQFVWNSSGVFYAITYLAMFALPLFGMRTTIPRPPLLIKIFALSGFAMTLLYVALSIIPIIPVENRIVFAIKILGLILIANFAGLSLFHLAAARRKSGT